MKRTLTLALICLPVLFGCQKAIDPSLLTGNDTSMEKEAQVVKAANGTLYDVKCIRLHSAEIQADSSKLSGCKFDAVGAKGRGFYTSASYYVYWPPTYYAPTYNYYNSSPTYSSSTNANSTFCGYVFGGATNYNCYYLFGFGNNGSSTYGSTYSNNQSWTTQYNASCDYCLYAYNPSKCRNKCWSSCNF